MRSTVVRLIEWSLAVTVSLPLGDVAAYAQTAFATQLEINVWKQRILTGPYREDWQRRILPRAQPFKTAPEMYLWLGNQLDLPWSGEAVRNRQQPPNYHPGRK